MWHHKASEAPPTTQKSCQLNYMSGLCLLWKQLFNLAEQTDLPVQLHRKENGPMWATSSTVWHSFLSSYKGQDQFSSCFLGRVGSLFLPHISAVFEKPMSSPQLPAFLWDKHTLTTTLSDPAYLVKVLFFFALLMTLVTLLILVWKVTRDKGNKNREPDQRKEATLLAWRPMVLGGDYIEVKTWRPRGGPLRSCLKSRAWDRRTASGTASPLPDAPLGLLLYGHFCYNSHSFCCSLSSPTPEFKCLLSVDLSRLKL